MINESFKLLEKSNISWVNYELLADRIDSQYYSTKYVQNEIKLLKCGLKIDKLESISEWVKKGIFDMPAKFYLKKREEGIPFIRISNIKLLEFDTTDLVYIPKEIHKKEIKTELNKGDIVISKIGSIGNIGIINEELSPCNFSQNNIGIKMNGKIDSHYLATYMISKYCLFQLHRYSTIQVQSKLNLSDIRNLIVPIPSPEIQKYIGDKVRKAEELRKEAKRLKKEVLDRLNTLLFNPNIKIDNNKFLYLDCKEIIDYKIGATIYRPKYVSNRRGLKQGIKLLKLKDISRKIYDGNHGSVHPKNILDEGDIPFIRAQDAHDGLVEINKYISNEEYRLLKHKTINYGDIVYGIKGSVGKGGIYLYENSDATVNPACVVISPKKLVNSGYLIEVLESDYFNNEIYRFAESDSTRPQISRTEFEELEVPMVSEEEQKAIGDLVFRRIKAINQSKQLIQEAKQDVEDLIEGNFDMSKVKANS